MSNQRTDKTEDQLDTQQPIQYVQAAQLIIRRACNLEVVRFNSMSTLIFLTDQ